MLKKTVKIIAALLVLIVGVIIYILFAQKPSYSGTFSIDNLQEKVTVYYDDYGVPHIYADNDLDAMTALGYVHAQDRLWQMEVVRRIAAGKLSEIFGEKLVETDQFFLSLGIEKNAKETIAKMDKNSDTYKQTMAYLNGVNEYVKTGKTPIEFTIIGVEKSTFDIADIYNVFGYMGYGFAMGNRTDPLMSAIKDKLGEEYLQNLDLIIDKNKTMIKTSLPKKDRPSLNEDDAVLLSKTANALFKHSFVAPFEGSNSWVLGPEKTKNGKVIFANDPHIAYSQPGVWYQAHISTPTTELYGFYLALTPFPLLGHNRDMAYGLTMFENDDIDLYIEQNNPENPNEYLYDGEYRTYSTRTETIKVKDAETVTLRVKESHHGPIMNNVVPQIMTEKPVSMYWVYTHRPNTLLEATYTLSRAKDIKTFQEGASLIHAPGLNVMYGDAKGNIGWWASANLYQRANNAPTKLLLDGTNPGDDDLNYRPFSENPQAVNPESHYVYSCNNQPDSLVSGRYVPGYYLAENRAKRVVELVESKNNWTLGENLKMAVDNTSSIAPDLVKIIVENISVSTLNEQEKMALDALKNWNGEASLTSIGTTIYTHFNFEYLQAVLEDEMGVAIYEQLNDTHFIGRMIAPLLEGKYPIWMDNIHTASVKETNAEIQLLAFQNTVKALQEHLGDDINTWTWNRVHTLEHKHPLGEIGLLRPYFNVGPFPMSGTNEVINNQIFSPNADVTYNVHSGPSTRRVIDFSDIENAKAIVPTGQSGNIMSPHYKDQALLFNEGKFITMLLNKEQIQEFEEKLILQPNSKSINK